MPTTDSAPKELISDIWYLNDTIELIRGTNTHFKAGSNIWFPVEPVIELGAFERMPTYCAVITFSESTEFTAEVLPTLHYKTLFNGMYFYEPYLTHQFFYGANGRVAGFLMLGDVPKDEDISLTVQHSNRISKKIIHITTVHDETDYGQATTRQLVEQVVFNRNLTRLLPYGMWGSGRGEGINYDIEYFMSHNSAAIELLKRKDAVDTMFLVMNKLAYVIDPSDNILILLEYDAFYQQMTPDQLEEYYRLKDEQTDYLEQLYEAQSEHIFEEIIIHLE